MFKQQEKAARDAKKNKGKPNGAAAGPSEAEKKAKAEAEAKAKADAAKQEEDDKVRLLGVQGDAHVLTRLALRRLLAPTPRRRARRPRRT